MPPDEDIVVREAGHRLPTENPDYRDRSETKQHITFDCKKASNTHIHMITVIQQTLSKIQLSLLLLNLNLNKLAYRISNILHITNVSK